MTPISWLLWCLISFSFGSIPFGVLLAKLKKVDLRTVGSGNTGATNVGRALGRRWGLLCFVLDAAKGATPAHIASYEGHVDVLVTKDWIELFIRNEKILSPDSEISRKFHRC